jgi:CRISPR-associated exonuclease Cas4
VLLPGYLPWAVVGVAVGLVTYGALRLRESSRDLRRGRLVGVDDGAGRGTTLRSARWRLAGRPDEIRALADGRWVPVEWKSRATPRTGPAPSHRIQVLAYCLLVEEVRGRAPPFGILRYGDGQEFRIPWTPASRSEVIALRRAIAAQYDGRALPSPGKCRGCRWRDGCDARSG